MRKCTPREIIKEVPDVQTVILPDHWFDNLNDKTDVFNSLYEWMLKSGGVPPSYEKNIHNRTYVGEKLYNKLLATEKKRLGKKLKIKGEELDRAVAWSDINSGPKAEIGSCKIAGDVILVIPESSRQALGEFSSKLFRKEREAAVNKIRANAAGANFYQWLLSQIDRPDRVGDVARDAAVSEDFPRESNQYEELKCFYGGFSAGVESIKEGWLEYIQQYPERVRPCAWCSECDKRLNVEDAFLAWSTESGELFILDAECLGKYKRFDEMASRPLSGVTHVDLIHLVEKEEISELDTERLEESLKLWGVLLQNSGGSAQSDGKRRRHGISREVKNAVWRRDRGCCVECGSKEHLEYDHIIPHSKGGSDTERNIQLLCMKCNRAKHAQI